MNKRCLTAFFSIDFFFVLLVVFMHEMEMMKFSYLFLMCCLPWTRLNLDQVFLKLLKRKIRLLNRKKVYLLLF